MPRDPQVETLRVKHCWFWDKAFTINGQLQKYMGSLCFWCQ